MSLRIASILNFKRVSATPAETLASDETALYSKTSDGGFYLKDSSGIERSLPDVVPVRVSTTGEFALTGIPSSASTDGVTVGNGDRVLVRHQGVGQPGYTNGVYVVNSTGAWTRSTDANTSAKVAGMLVSPTEGTKFRGVVFRSAFKSTDTLDTTGMQWADTASQVDHGATYPNPSIGHLFFDTANRLLGFNPGGSWTYPKGIMDVATSAPANPKTGETYYDSTYDILFLWNGTAWDRVGYGPAMKSSTSTTSGSLTTSATTVLTLISAPAASFDGATEVSIEFSAYNFVKSVASDTFLLRIMDGATQLQQQLLGYNTAVVNAPSGPLRAVLTPSAGSHTFSVTVVRNTGTGTINIQPTATTPMQLTVTPR